MERTRAGMSRVRKRGEVDRPRPSTVLLHAAAKLVAAGVPVAQAARRKGGSRASLTPVDGRKGGAGEGGKGRDDARRRGRWPVTCGSGHRPHAHL